MFNQEKNMIIKGLESESSEKLIKHEELLRQKEQIFINEKELFNL